MSELQRLKEVADWLIYKSIVKNRRELAEVLGYTESSLSQILNGKVPLSQKFLKRLSKIDERINIDWIKTGKGDMVKEKPRTVAIEVDPEEISQQIGQGFFERVLKLIQSGDLYPSNVVEGYKDRISELENENGNLQREIGRLEAVVKELKNK